MIFFANSLKLHYTIDDSYAVKLERETGTQCYCFGGIVYAQVCVSVIGWYIDMEGFMHRCVQDTYKGRVLLLRHP